MNNILSLARLLIIPLLFIAPQTSYAFRYEADYAGCSYISGSDLLEAHPQLVASEKGFLTEVPLKYSDPQGARTSLYSRFLEPYDNNKPTWVYFSGGPGADSHDKNEYIKALTPTWANVLVLEPRGVAFSRLASASEARDPLNYGSEITARDTAEVLKQKGIKKVVVVGVSYGTVAATIFAHLFPDVTESIMLAGTYYDNPSSYSQLPQHFKKFTNLLNPQVLNAFLGNEISTWFVYTFRLAVDDGWIKVPYWREALEKAVLVDRSLDHISEYYDNLIARFNLPLASPSMVQETSDPCRKLLSSYNDNYAVMIVNDNNSIFLDFPSMDAKGDLHANAVQVPLTDVSSAFDFTKAHPSVYSAADYPIEAPVYYFQGDFDWNTNYDGALKHYSKVPLHQRQMLVLNDIGHNTINTLYKYNVGKETQLRALMDRLFLNIQRGEIIDSTLVEELAQFSPAVSIQNMNSAVVK